MDLIKGKYIVLYDGDCGFCNFWVRWILERDEDDHFMFAALQSQFGQNFLKKNNLSQEKFDTLYLITPSGSYFERSSAVMQIGRTLGGIYTSFQLGILLPKAFRDFLYNKIAKNRQKLASARCLLPTAEERRKFIV